MEEPITTCINCGEVANGNYCPNCSQRTNVKRINVKEGWHDFWSRVYGFDGMFPRTLRDLTIRPGIVARVYINRNRVKYYGPVGYFFFMISLCLLLFSIIDLDYMEYMKGMQSRLAGDQYQTKGFQKISRFVTDNIKIFAFLIIPFQALSAQYLFFRKSGYNFLEHTILPFYVIGHVYWLTIIGGVILQLTGFSVAGITGIALIFIIGFAYSGLMTYQSKGKAFLKGLLSYLTATVGFVITMFILIAIAIVILPVIAPDFYQQIKPSNNL